MADNLREFYHSLNREEADLAADIAADRLGLLMRIAINELDLDFEGVHLINTVGDANHERWYIMRIGVIRIIKLAMQAHQQFEAPTLTFQRDLRYSLSVLSLIRKVGTIEHGRRVAQSVTVKSGRIERLPDCFHIVLPSQLIDLELHERELERYHVAQQRAMFANDYEALIGSKIGDEVRALLTELVYPFRDHFIGYEADPALDFYFFGHAYNEIMLAKGFDTFHFSTIFGGITFSNYKLAAMFIVSIGMKHRAFVRALMDKRPTIRIEDILTVSVATDGFLEGLREFINEFGKRFGGHVPVTDKDVRIIFDVLSVNRRNLALLDRPGAPIPPLIQCSDDHVIRPLAGATSDEVMLFLLNSLQHSFPKDYDRAQRTREGAMQRAVESTLRPLLPELEFRGNVKLRQSGKVLTDLDLVVIEPSTDRVVLIQLKHQDPYGADLATMQARTGRLNQQVSDWLRKVRSWFAAASTSEVRATLRLPSSMTSPVVSLLALTRHYAHSLRLVVDGNDAVFSNWSQLVTAVERLQERGEPVPTVDDLLDELRILSVPEEEHYLPEPPSDWTVGSLRFTIEQERD
ncbi:MULTISPECIES: hypothetical protein [unclassified Beijerinckia]|uniref:hypothetical protein n=1 Tax=unclassified Beijerinckia TaxID=2638183 RepID=UPI0008959CEC|nr:MULTISPECIES: hypothetical protein [unclassified Beijerinckia]MDH7794901.1 hypothetical protein [Beijerinckia sp. GAS462]SEB79762.1 hypothetical protein SAMN05443249_1174 [Beijerinckia sp. 28-YEA-48]